ncbi:hypothetical protein K432DRAFT_137012 [Lepidopterella palustris CBS 459.81]|uniref:Uncharacterized protein n=1 Tax=Lepidopterella palustris CBS 459.81 TaxID=1314670 RepID=A0A8E2EIJ4_9PEZI|nr:hypothetical protein K432DRAFT_137012 [Lepidopterella palustris CBS 459.81]
MLREAVCDIQNTTRHSTLLTLFFSPERPHLPPPSSFDVFSFPPPCLPPTRPQRLRLPSLSRPSQLYGIYFHLPYNTTPQLSLLPVCCPYRRLCETLIAPSTQSF